MISIAASISIIRLSGSVSVSTIVRIASITAGIRSGRACAIPMASSTISCMPVFMISGAIEMIILARSTISRVTVGIIFGRASIRPLARVSITSPAAVSKGGSASSIILGSFLAMTGAISDTICDMPCSACSITGSRLPAKVSTEKVRSSSASVICSSLPVPNAVSTFCQVACIMLSDPEMVSLASRAVVPAIPMLSCITWIALTTSA